MLEKEHLDNGVDIFWNIDKKFHDYIMRYRFVFPLCEKERTYANLLMRMMVNRVEGYESKKQFRKRLNMLYGTRVRASSYAIGSYQVLEVQLRGIADRYVETSLFKEQMQVLEDVLYRPILDGNSFIEAQKNLILEHERMADQTREKALHEALRLAGEGQKLSLSTLGDPILAKDTSLKDIQNFHRNLLKNSYQSLVITGNVQKQSLQQYFKESKSPGLENVFSKTDISSAFHVDKHQGDQSELILIYNPNIFPGDRNYLAYMVYIAYLGQFPNSLLFREVREKHGLCYSIHASRLIFDGVFLIQTSVADDKLEQTLQIIQKIIADSKEKIQDITAIKKAMIASLDGVDESLSALNQRAFYEIVGANQMTVKEMQAAIDKVEKEDLLKIANTLEEPFVYAYRGVDRT